MTKTPLKTYLAQPGRSQAKLGAAVNLTQGAIGKMIRTSRNIFVVEHDDGSITLLEEKVIYGEFVRAV